MSTVFWWRLAEIRYAPASDEFGHPCGDGRTDVQAHCFPVLKETPCGVWLDVYGQKRFVLRGARKRFACPTLEEAAESFRARKQKQLRILAAQIRHIEHAVALLDDEVRRAEAVGSIFERCL